MKKNLYLLIFVAAAGILFTACATQSVSNVTNPPGFLHGLLHGFIILFSFIASMFTDYELYAFPNTGFGYNFGFLIGTMLFWGGGGASSKRCR